MNSTEQHCNFLRTQALEYKVSGNQNLSNLMYSTLSIVEENTNNRELISKASEYIKALEEKIACLESKDKLSMFFAPNFKKITMLKAVWLKCKSFAELKR